MNGIDPRQLREIIVAPALNAIGLGGAAAEELIVRTTAQESAMGRYLHQLGGGPAVGIEEMEPTTHDDIWTNFLAFRTPLAMKVRPFLIEALPRVDQLAGNLYYAVIMARLKYYRAPDPFPSAGDVPGQAAYYKRFYNTAGGAATMEQIIANFTAAVA